MARLFRRCARRSVASAVLGLVASFAGRSAAAGNLDQCDLARVAAHNTILRIYGQALSELDAKIATAKTRNLDITKMPYLDADNKPQTIDVVFLEAALRTQEAKDAAQSDRDVSRSCEDQLDSIETITKSAEATATRGIASVLPKHMVFQGL